MLLLFPLRLMKEEEDLSQRSQRRARFSLNARSLLIMSLAHFFLLYLLLPLCVSASSARGLSSLSLLFLLYLLVEKPTL
jgi:hypothetical protein